MPSVKEMKEAVGELLKALGYTEIANNITEMQGPEIEKQVMEKINYDLEFGNGTEYIPGTKQKNPNRKKYLHFKKILQISTKKIKEKDARSQKRKWKLW